eukprot:CAMPEP_0117490318 /NCGR_PEP_ID=MMETSP0784-20121206/17491_1 /TAXON_ID=39447 /ORGANISM="" /LENGTH=452 /DNA_ID=CAMNT_0005285077 /DNA_START=75 /DNA_END=1433 /DNA_ORIENTATION=-
MTRVMVSAARLAMPRALRRGRYAQPCGTLYVVATPIGNIQDLSKRAMKVLGSVHTIAAESVSAAEALLQAIDRETPPRAEPAQAPRVLSYHCHNEAERVPELLSTLEAGQDVAIVSRVGTPGWRDPGQVLVSAAHKQGLLVCPLPGPSSVAAAVSASGLLADRVFFDGFLPTLRDMRMRRLRQLRAAGLGDAGGATLALFGDGATLDDVLSDLAVVFGEGVQACVAKDISMPYEHIMSAPLGALLSWWSRRDASEKRGTLVLLVALPRTGAIVGPNDADLGLEASTRTAAPGHEGHDLEVLRIVRTLYHGGVSPHKTALLAMQLTGATMDAVQGAVQQVVAGDVCDGDTENKADARPLENRRKPRAGRTLHLVNLGPYVTKEELVVSLARLNVTASQVNIGRNHHGEKIAFLLFPTMEEATTARGAINFANLLLGSRRPLIAGWARRELWLF